MADVNNWNDHIHIGYVAIGEDGAPYQPTLRSSYHKRKKPITVYKNAARAAFYSPIGQARQVRMFAVELLND